MSDHDTQVQYDPVERMLCVACRARMDVSGFPPFSKAICPSCKTEMVVPARLGSFLLTELLGTGGMGGVYRAHDETLGRDVAIKVMLKSLGDNPEFVSSFRREAQAAAKLNHPNIAQIYSFGQEKGQPYIVMELVSGPHFDDMISGPEPLAIPLIMKIGLDITGGLQMAADANLIHGDIKPENILLDERNQAKLVDFGIAAKPSKGEGEIWGTPYYIAPEKVRRQKVDFRSDIYCLGGTLYHAITQHPPFDGSDAIEVVKARLKDPPAPMETYREDVDPAVSDIIMRMLQLEPAMRYPTYGSLISDMRSYLSRVNPQMPVREPSKRFIIKGRKAAKSATTASLSSTSGFSQTGRQPLVITRGMTGLTQQVPEIEEDEPEPVSKKALVIGVSVVVALLLAGAAGAMVFLHHQKKQAERREKLAATDLRDRQRTLVNVQKAITVGRDQLSWYEARCYAATTQAVELVEMELGGEWRERIITPDPEPEQEIEVARLNEESDTGAPAATDPEMPAEQLEDTDKQEDPAETDTESSQTEAVEEKVSTDKQVGDEAEEPGKDSDKDSESTDESPAVEEAVEPEKEAVEPEEETLPSLAAIAREIHLTSLPLRQALRSAEDKADKSKETLRATLSATNALEAVEETEEIFAAIHRTIQASAVDAPRILEKAQQLLESLQREVQLLADQRAQEAEAEKKLAEERRAAEALAARQAKELAAIQAEIALVIETVASQRDDLLEHRYSDVLRSLDKIQHQLQSKEGKAAHDIAVKRITGLQDLRVFLIRRFKETPFRAFDGWRVTQATERSLSIVSRNGRKSEILWQKIGIPQMAEFIRFYIQDEQESRKLRLRERFSQTVNAAIYIVTFSDSDTAMQMAKSLRDKAIEMIPSEREDLQRLLPEIE